MKRGIARWTIMMAVMGVMGCPSEKARDASSTALDGTPDSAGHRDSTAGSADSSPGASPTDAGMHTPSEPTDGSDGAPPDQGPNPMVDPAGGKMGALFEVIPDDLATATTAVVAEVYPRAQLQDRVRWWGALFGNANQGACVNDRLASCPVLRAVEMCNGPLGGGADAPLARCILGLPNCEATAASPNCAVPYAATSLPVRGDELEFATPDLEGYQAAPLASWLALLWATRVEYGPSVVVAPVFGNTTTKIVLNDPASPATYRVSLRELDDRWGCARWSPTVDGCAYRAQMEQQGGKPLYLTMLYDLELIDGMILQNYRAGDEGRLNTTLQGDGSILSLLAPHRRAGPIPYMMIAPWESVSQLAEVTFDYCDASALFRGVSGMLYDVPSVAAVTGLSTNVTFRSSCPNN